MFGPMNNYKKCTDFNPFNTACFEEVRTKQNMCKYVIWSILCTDIKVNPGDVTCEVNHCFLGLYIVSKIKNIFVQLFI